MAEAFYLATQNAHVPNRIVQFLRRDAHDGFLLTRETTGEGTKFYAFYANGDVEEIDPPNGTPRPVPDPAVRSLNVVIPPSLQSGIPEQYNTGSKFSGAIRPVVQSEHSRGIETRFNWRWSKTHGLLEHPRPRFVGADEFEEAELRAERKHYVIEVTSLGVFAAPVVIGANSATYGLIQEYLPTDDQLAANPGWQQYRDELSLWWAFTLGGSGKVLQLLTPVEIAGAYAHGIPWDENIGWAFDIYGREAANVVSITRTDGIDFSSIEDYYETRLLTLTFDVTEQQQDTSIQLFDPTTALANSAGHGLLNGQLVSIYGADQDEYNGPHVVKNVTTDTFQYAITGSPSSPATGSIYVVNPLNEVTLAASLVVGAGGKVTFRRHTGGTLWVPDAADTSNWIGVFPFLNVLDGSGPVHVFYDGEQQILTDWSGTVSSVPAFETPPIIIPPIVPIGGVTIYWDGTEHNGAHSHFTEACTPFFACQSGDGVFNPDCVSCEGLTGPFTIGGAGEQITAYTNTNHGFSNVAMSLQVDSYNRTAKYANTVDQGILGVLINDITNSYGLCQQCYFVRPGVGQITGCTSTFHQETDVHGWLGRRHDVDEIASGTSVAIIFPREREAIAGFTATRVEESGTDYTANQSQFRVGRRETKTDAGDCPFTNWAKNDHGIAGGIGLPFPQGNPGTSDVDNVLLSGSWSLKTVGALRTGALTFTNDGAVTNPDFAGFSYWTKGQHETAQAGLFAMRGGLFHDDATLDPPAGQVANSLTQVDNVLEINGGFSDLDGKFGVGFVGLV